MKITIDCQVMEGKDSMTHPRMEWETEEGFNKRRDREKDWIHLKVVLVITQDGEPDLTQTRQTARFPPKRLAEIKKDTMHDILGELAPEWK